MTSAMMIQLATAMPTSTTAAPCARGRCRGVAGDGGAAGHAAPSQRRVKKSIDRRPATPGKLSLPLRRRCLRQAAVRVGLCRFVRLACGPGVARIGIGRSDPGEAEAQVSAEARADLGQALERAYLALGAPAAGPGVAKMCWSAQKCGRKDAKPPSPLARERFGVSCLAMSKEAYMRMTGKLLLAAVAVAALSGTAMAADLPAPAAPAAVAPEVVPPSTSWDGAYIGANIGYSWAESDVTSTTAPDSWNTAAPML